MSWKSKTRAVATGEVKAFTRDVKGHIDGLALAIAEASTPSKVASIEALSRPSALFAERVLRRIDQLSVKLVAPTGEPDSERAWRARIGDKTRGMKPYVQGWVDGGGAFASVVNDVDGPYDDPKGVTRCLRERLAFITERTENWVEKWVGDLGHIEAAPSGEDTRLAELLHIARFWEIEFKVPANPSPAWVGKLDKKLEGAIVKRRARRARKNRLDALLGFADIMKVRIRQVPDNPSDGYLDKFEAKLRQIALKKGVSVPELAGHPVAEPPPYVPAFGGHIEPEFNADPHTQIEAADAPVETPTEDTHARIESMLEKAERAGLQLGRVPHDPSPEWLLRTEQILEDAMAKRKAQRRAERQAKQKARQERIDRIKTQADLVGLELGRFPPFPTEDWLGRIELQIADRILASQDVKGPSDGARRARFLEVMATAERMGIDLGELPPDPDEGWLNWAESRVSDAEMKDEVFVVGDDHEEAEDAPSIPRLFFERGTVQEESWALDKDRIVIGRSRSSNIQILHDAGISRQHCAIYKVGDDWMVEDLGSSRGTTLDGVAVTSPLALYPEATVLVGESALVFALT